ncbi:glycosyltransferase family 4 protein [Methylobacterium sp. J-090]|uniref:glycosyltransferase family 4 protein n=1 Tax=Methylobacterium sp. J-090 TaxID=2836666 RepID=UPI001FB8A131|nr:glycosyltransferase family 1 protein [Methylobacterium sp. J-090]MCJ2082826.1 glycosyltransferase family 4 protein [Methylobacterium sp. J-090]
MTTDPSAYAINGRFLTQPLTGVQRYAREVLGALDRSLAATRQRSTLVAPPKPSAIPRLDAIDVSITRSPGGHLWEQAVLPINWRGPLLNLCNTAPVMRASQVVCIHDANVFRMPDSYGWRFRALYRTLQPMIVRRAARIATVSHDAARQLAEHLPIALRDVEILPNGHEHALRWNAAAARVFSEKPQDRPFVLLLGSRARHKNIGLILGLADTLDALGVDLLVAGGDGGIFTGIETVRAANIRMLGRVSDDDLALLFSRAICLAFPSFTEGFGLPVLEAMASGCPVVSSDRSSLPEICGGAALMASPNDPETWTAHLAALAGSTALRDDLRGRGRIQAARYSWNTTARGYLDLCGRLS